VGRAVACPDIAQRNEPLDCEGFHFLHKQSCRFRYKRGGLAIALAPDSQTLNDRILPAERLPHAFAIEYIAFDCLQAILRNGQIVPVSRESGDGMPLYKGFCKDGFAAIAAGSEDDNVHVEIPDFRKGYPAPRHVPDT
jgi:hypothetical protein